MGLLQPARWLMRRQPIKEFTIPIAIWRAKRRNRGAVLPEFRPSSEGKGNLSLSSNVPILILSGTPEEIGYQHGRLLGEQIRFLTERYLGSFVLMREDDLRRAERMLEHIRPHHQAELRALAEGADIPWEDALLTACFLDIHKVAACSTVVAHDAASSNDGEIIFGRNLDFPPLGVATQASVVFVYRPEGRRPFVSVGWPGFSGCLTGLNVDGLAMAMMLIYGHPYSDHLNGEPFALHYRRVVEECTDVDSATAMLKRREYAVSNNMMLADKSRNARVLELHTKSVGEIGGDPEFPVLRCTNHFRTGHRRWALAFTMASSWPRLRVLNRVAQRQEKLDPDRVKELLATVAIPGINLQRILIYPERGELEVGVGTCERGPREYVYLNAETLWSN